MSENVAPREAYFIAEEKLRDGERFVGTCIDYHGGWWFPTLMHSDAMGTYIFVLKETGDAFYFDPAFNALEFAKSPNVSSQVPELQALVHHGVKGMKWGVRHERNKTGLQKAYERELAKPGSQSKKAISNEYLSKKRMQNNVARFLLAREAAIGSLTTLIAGVEVGGAVATAAAQYGAAATAAAFAGPIGLTVGLAGATVASGVAASRANRRYKSLRTSADIRNQREANRG